MSPHAPPCEVGEVLLLADRGWSQGPGSLPSDWFDRLWLPVLPSRSVALSRNRGAPAFFLPRVTQQSSRAQGQSVRLRSIDT